MFYNRYRENLFIITVFIVMFEYQLSLVQTYIIDRIIKIVAFSVLIIFFRNIRDNKRCIYIQKIDMFYLFLFLLMTLSTITNLNTNAVIFLIKYSLFILFVLILLHKVHPDFFSDRIIIFPIFIGAVLSIHSITVLLLVYFGIEPDWAYVVSERHSRINRFSYFWGDMAYLSGQYLRASSFFETPNRFGNFLIFPAFVGFGYFVLRKKFVYLFVSILCFVTIGLTLAFTILLASLATISINIYFRKASGIPWLKKSPLMVGIIGLLLALMVMAGVMKYYSSQFEESSEAVFRGGYYKTIFYSLLISGEDLVPNITKPFGNGLGYYRFDRFYTAQYGLVLWILLLGYPGAIFFMVFIAYMFKVHVFPALISQERRIERYVALAFVAQTFCEFQEGSWLSLNYLFTTAILVLLKAYSFRSRKRQFNSVQSTASLRWTAATG